MKSTYYLFLCSCILAILVSCKTEVDLRKDISNITAAELLQLNGNVRSLEEVPYLLLDSSTETGKLKLDWSFLEFETNGNLIQESYNPHSGKSNSPQKRNPNSNFSRIPMYLSSPSHKDLIYDKKNMIRQMSTIINRNLQIGWYENHVGNNSGIILKTIHQSTKGYDTKYETESESITILYDKYGNITEEKIIDFHYKPKKNVYAYPDSSIVEKNIYSNENKLVIKEIYRYNDSNDEIEFIKIDIPNNNIEKWSAEYEYDETGNWVTKFISKNDILKFTVNRKIEYYPEAT